MTVQPDRVRFIPNSRHLKYQPSFQSCRKFGRALLEERPIKSATDLECQMMFTVHRAFDHRVNLTTRQFAIWACHKCVDQRQGDIEIFPDEISASDSAYTGIASTDRGESSRFRSFFVRID